VGNRERSLLNWVPAPTGLTRSLPPRKAAAS
jgi:hypothetical protein